MARSWWQPWKWFRSQHPRPVLRVIVYTRANCHLCDQAAEFLNSQQRRQEFEVEWIDVDQDDELRSFHGDWVPVIEINGKVRFRGSINPVLWERMMKAMARER